MSQGSGDECCDVADVGDVVISRRNHSSSNVHWRFMSATFHFQHMLHARPFLIMLGNCFVSVQFPFPWLAQAIALHSLFVECFAAFVSSELRYGRVQAGHVAFSMA